ncbi:elongation factor P 5-aminopentanone reductase [Lactobacillus sp. PV034]|uniref:elongation factor P 5-aminopentanone reductase n=1 Tax=Lactobacillus sp. PV034 TaxID=2594495 RepID=UPI00223EC5C7|nr:SDR family NAD(P)-dependent oxidoreductase [Lactobacillus sp. PV034]QNQ80733.1 SDR family NAD(P)-dependent oxidoreductase [Lactobacillus sp. PV034]
MKRAIIFGATGGIGQEIAFDLAEAGWSLYLHFEKNELRAKQIQKKLVKLYPQQEFFLLQLSFLDPDEKFINLSKGIFSINAVIFAQGITDYNFLSAQSLTTIEKILKINMVTPIKLTKLLTPLLLSREHSRIIYLGSVYGKQGSALESVYSASKSGISRFVQAYAREVAMNNLTVNVLAPGAVDTPMNEIFSADVIEEVKDEIPVNRLAVPRDISFWVKNLLSPQADYLTGQTIYIDGGWLV